MPPLSHLTCTSLKLNLYLKSRVYTVIKFKHYANSSITEAARYTILHSLMSKNNKSSITDKNCRSICYGSCNTRNSMLSLCPATKHQDNYYSCCYLFTSILTNLIQPHSINLLVFQMMISSYIAWVWWSVLGWVDPVRKTRSHDIQSCVTSWWGYILKNASVGDIVVVWTS